MKQNKTNSSFIKKIKKRVFLFSDADDIDNSVKRRKIEPWSAVWVIRQFFAFIVQVFNIVTYFIADGYEKLVDLTLNHEKDEDELDDREE